MFKKTPNYQHFKIIPRHNSIVHIIYKTLKQANRKKRINYYRIRSALLTNCSSFFMKCAAKKAKTALTSGKNEPKL